MKRIGVLFLVVFVVFVMNVFGLLSSKSQQERQIAD